MIFGFLLRVLVWAMPQKSVTGALRNSQNSSVVNFAENFSLTHSLSTSVLHDFWDLLADKRCSRTVEELANLNLRFPDNLNIFRALIQRKMPELEWKSQVSLKNTGTIYKALNNLRNVYPAVTGTYFSWSPTLLTEITSFSGEKWRTFLVQAIKQRISSPLYVFQAMCSIDGAFTKLISIVFFEDILHDSSPLLLIQVNLESLDVDLCAVNDLPRALHNCNGVLTQCKSRKSEGSFHCCCINDDKICMNGSNMAQFANDTEGLDALCNGAPNYAMRRVLLCVNCVCIVASVTLIFLIMTQRRIQQYGVRGWALMELFLVGAVLLYGITVVDFLDLRGWSCCAMQWLRELGFGLFYGAVVLKIYRNLIENRVRKAHHVYVKEKDMLKYMILILVTVFTSLIAWNIGAAQSQMSNQFPFISLGNRPSNSTTGYRICQLQWWGGAWHAYEMVFLIYGLSLCYKARHTAWVEKWQFTAAVAIEAILTFSANMIRYYAWYSSNRDAMFLLSFIQTHLTVSLNIMLIVVPKFYYIRADHGRARSIISPNRSSKAHPSLAKLRDNLVNGTIDFAEVPITEMNPEDIRAELKRVYTQLRMYKLKNIYQENPHISGKRRGKKQSDKQTTKRRVSIPTIPLISRDKSKIEEEVSSTNRSNEEDQVPLGPVSLSDLTVESSPHNVYLARSCLAANKKLQMEQDQSVRV